MQDNLKIIFDEILEKKFAKNMAAGYDPLEVDLFLDNIRSFLVQLNNYQNNLLNIIKQKENKIETLKEQIDQKNNLIKLLNNEIETYKRDGYQSQRLINEVGKLHVEINNLKKTNWKKNK